MRRLSALGRATATVWFTSLCLMSGAALAPSPPSVLVALAADPSPSPTPGITLVVKSGVPSTPLVIVGSGFPPGEIVAIYIDSPGPYLGFPPPGPRADAQGAFQQNLKWPGKNYDVSGKVDPTKAGPHNVCADTSYPGSTQPIAAKACAPFQVQVVPTTPTPSPSPVAVPASGYPLPIVLGVFVILIVIGAGAVLWMRRSR
jgi:hypothetical protein